MTISARREPCPETRRYRIRSSLPSESFRSRALRLFLRRNDASRKTRLESAARKRLVVVGNLFLTDHYKITKAKIEIFFHLQTLLDDLVQFFTGQPTRSNRSRNAGSDGSSAPTRSRVANLCRRRHDRRQFLRLLKYQPLIDQQPQRAIQTRSELGLSSCVFGCNANCHIKIGIRDQLGPHTRVNRRHHLVDDLLRRTHRTQTPARAPKFFQFAS